MDLNTDAAHEQFLRLLAAQRRALAAAEAIANPYPEVAKLLAEVRSERAAFEALVTEGAR